MWVTHRNASGTTGLFVEWVAELMWAACGHCLLSVVGAKRSHCLSWAWMPTSGLSPRPLQPPLKVHSRVRGSVSLLHGHCVDGGSSSSPNHSLLSRSPDLSVALPVSDRHKQTQPGHDADDAALRKKKPRCSDGVCQKPQNKECKLSINSLVVN